MSDGARVSRLAWAAGSTTYLQGIAQMARNAAWFRVNRTSMPPFGPGATAKTSHRNGFRASPAESKEFW
jgi:hypothetical protein